MNLSGASTVIAWKLLQLILKRLFRDITNVSCLLKPQVEKATRHQNC